MCSPLKKSVCKRNWYRKDLQYTFRESSDEKNGRDRSAENHTKGVFLLLSYSFVTFLRQERYPYCVFSALQSLRHASRDTAIYTREAFNMRQYLFINWSLIVYITNSDRIFFENLMQNYTFLLELSCSFEARQLFSYVKPDAMFLKTQSLLKKKD